MQITFVGITTEKEYPKEILDSIDGFFDEVLIRTESPSVFQRYLLAEKAKNDIIYVQDDDCIVDIKELWKHYNGQLTNGITEHHLNAYKGSGVTLVGWGCFFPKEMLKNLGQYIDRYGVDKHLLREADRIFTYLNKPFNTIVTPHSDFKPQVGRMWNEGNHWSSMAEAIEKCRLL